LYVEWVLLQAEYKPKFLANSREMPHRSCYD
jgi:hypothetical protein